MASYRVIITPKSGVSALPASETLFGAVCWSIRLLYGEEALETLLDGFENSEQRFYLSSAFPCLRVKDSYAFYYPRPFGLPFPREEAETGEYKRFQQATYLSEPLFESWLQGEQDANLYRRFREGQLTLCGNLLGESEDFLGLEPQTKRAVFAGTKLDRLHASTAGAGELFFYTRSYYSEDTAFYFHLHTSDPDYIIPALRLAAERGLGGDRSVGRAAYEVEAVEPYTPPFQTGRVFITLSRYLPQEQELDLDAPAISYRLVSCRARVESALEFHGEDIWKRQLLYFKEGSCLALRDEKPFPGQLPVVKELAGKKIRQYGYAYPAFMEGGDTHAS